MGAKRVPEQHEDEAPTPPPPPPPRKPAGGAAPPVPWSAEELAEMAAVRGNVGGNFEGYDVMEAIPEPRGASGSAAAEAEAAAETAATEGLLLDLSGGDDTLAVEAQDTDSEDVSTELAV